MGRGLKSILPTVGRSIHVQADELDDSLVLRTPGVTFYVDGENGDDDSVLHDGLDWGHAFATIDHAIGECVDGRGDVIYVNVGTYEENVVIDKDYVTLVGIQPSRYARPDIAPASGKALDVQSQGFVGMRLRFAAPAADTDLAQVQGNGCRFVDCVFDGDATMGNAKCLVRFKGVEDDDGSTGSENEFERCLFRGSGGVGVGFDVGDGAGNQVGATHNVFKDCAFQANDQQDIMAFDTSAGGTYSAQDNLFDNCKFMSRNKTVYMDFDTNHGATNTGNVFTGCFFAEDTPDATKFNIQDANVVLVGCFDMDGVLNGDALD